MKIIKLNPKVSCKNLRDLRVATVPAEYFIYIVQDIYLVGYYPLTLTRGSNNIWISCLPDKSVYQLVVREAENTDLDLYLELVKSSIVKLNSKLLKQCGGIMTEYLESLNKSRELIQYYFSSAYEV